MFNSITKQIPKDKDYTDRAYNIGILQHFLDGTCYDHLPYEFHEEARKTGEWVPFRSRKPSVRYNICRFLTEDSITFLFGEGRFPAVDSTDSATREALSDVIKNCRLQQTMSEAALAGSVGSVAVLMRVLKNDDGENRIYFEVLPTQFLIPVYDPNAPDTLMKVTQRYKISGSDLVDMGYSIAPDNMRSDYWFQRLYDKNSETIFLPMLVSDSKDDKGNLKPMIEDADRKVKHMLGFVPVVWIKNLPGGNGIDGACTFKQAIDAQIEIEYQLSQAGRALKYSADPMLIVRDGGLPEDGGAILKEASNVLFLGENGEAKYAEINGAAAQAVIDYCRTLREMALETVHGNRSPIDKLSLPQSGLALFILYQPLISLADTLRGSYGEVGLKSLLKMVLKAQNKLGNLQAGDVLLPKLDHKIPFNLRWPDFFSASDSDRQLQAATLVQLVAGGLMARDTGVKTLANRYDIEDVTTEISDIEADQAKREEADALVAATAKKGLIPNE
jgi:hypothetical protein